MIIVNSLIHKIRKSSLKVRIKILRSLVIYDFLFCRMFSAMVYDAEEEICGVVVTDCICIQQFLQPCRNNFK